MRKQIRGLQNVYDEVPKTTSALELRDFSEAANSFSPNVASPRPLENGKGTEVAATYVVSNTNPTGWPLQAVLGNNMHSGVFIIPDDGDPEGRFLYNPAGSYMNRQMGSGRTLYGSEVSAEDYVRYQLRDGPNVTVRRYATTPEEEEEIRKRAFDLGGAPAANWIDPGCTTGVSEAIRGIGPFRHVEQTMWPTELDSQLKGLRKHVGEAGDLESLRRLLTK
ncbi:hypothetical protein HR059_09360 [Sinorhizobium meliloti WSM1022]|uniref:hypothetical protein n=1 Tax=Rhizobium meliloti TaxID=382 RepID=UPI00042594BA|nr:hypothetical protein [Sinorhizobium meliloti]ASQ03709.1 hypothetical protein CDO23_06940 [Sinorhizobium meliloti]MCO6423020.1 hypothetical protein [Sinorhizobium meliloti]MDW9408088.1 hypothetical protein [Sinorhizobium meliloti]MDW9444757.1 hypothetical protein [Sinorhizobium meliloti]MDW9453549.1 hypothetical protein [Sinorhizobium meliloti]